MPDNSPQAPNSNKKSRLGRGLGSLLGGGALDTTEAAPAAAPPAPTPVAPATQSPSPAQPAQPTHQAKATAAKPDKPTTTQPTQKVQPTATTAKVANPVPQPVGPTTQPVATQPVPTQAPKAQTAPPRPVEQARVIPEENQIWMIAIDKLKPNTQQPRQIFTPEALRDLSASIKEKGILQPITARRLSEREFEIIAGERRWRAAQAAGLHQVPVILKKVNQQDSLELAIIENIQRENLNPLEESEAYERLMTDYSLTQQQVADKMGKERSTVANSLRLLVLPGEVKEFLRKNELSAGHAKVLLGLDDPKLQTKIARQIVADKLSVRATEKMVARAKIEARGGSLPTKPENNVSKRVVEGLTAELQKLIGTKVVIDYADSKGKLSIHFYDDDQLTHVVDKIRKAWEK